MSKKENYVWCDHLACPYRDTCKDKNAKECDVLNE